MAAPTVYFPQYNFTQYQTSHPATPLPAGAIDSELFAIATSIAEICSNLALIQNSDGTLGNQTVGINQLQTEIMIGVNAATVWLTGTNYIAGSSLVYAQNGVYLCAKNHLSGVFATDLANGDWIAIIDLSSSVNAASASATAAAASATTASGAVGALTATSSTSNTIGTGVLTFTTQAGKTFNPGGFLITQFWLSR